MKIAVEAWSGSERATPKTYGVDVVIAGITFTTKCNSGEDARHVAALVARALGLAKDPP